jgi:hypothetical protein
MMTVLVHLPDVYVATAAVLFVIFCSLASLYISCQLVLLARNCCCRKPRQFVAAQAPASSELSPLTSVSAD